MSARTSLATARLLRSKRRATDSSVCPRNNSVTTAHWRQPHPRGRVRPAPCMRGHQRVDEDGVANPKPAAGMRDKRPLGR